MDEKDFKKWKNRFPNTNIDENSTKSVRMHEYWSYKSNINATPTFFINGFQLPEVYQIEDIKRIAPYIFTE